MAPIKIGNWLITGDGIEWTGEIMNGYVINKDRLAEAGPSERENCYDWLLHLPEKNRITEHDIYALNTAFLLALEIFGVPLKTLSFKKTLMLQQQILKDKGKEEQPFMRVTHPSQSV